MILVDPELEPERRPPSAPGASLVESPKHSRNGRLPGARALNGFLRLAQEAVRLRGLVTVLLTTDAAIRRLNRRFRGKNQATDVLSFPAAEVSRGEVAGDLAISVETARRQAVEQGHALGTEIKVLMLHGLLHLAGYDHENDAGEMARRERRLRARLALPLGLIERSGGDPTHSRDKAARMDGARSSGVSGVSGASGVSGVSGASGVSGVRKLSRGKKA